MELQMIHLQAGQVIELGLDSRVSVVRGALWVTFEGCSQDFMFGPGEEVRLKGAKPVAEALKLTTLAIRAAVPPLKAA